MNIKDFSEVTSLSPHTLRYYEKIGLLLNIQRNPSGHRVYTSRDLEWAQFIVRLKDTGMPLDNILEYAQLRNLGDSTLAERQTLLEAHRSNLRRRIDDELLHLKALDKKIDYYKNQELP
ncbi:MerR family transcriptional regulator [Photobacterium alginatilyticum]|uniref:MerR family transcriptional regulator n=1 Tax=Photobacterium alginatilyticum TaxID=1775171 RepID=A0ABW9YMI1_9GAMM|nr:MerR family transcriptional regulator [Photobacterium alginatilyticum]NBI55077.1 MerR family transcriptional regulator [Photobacterium alginatilyticum]